MTDAAPEERPVVHDPPDPPAAGVGPDAGSRTGRIREWPLVTVLVVVAVGLIVTSRGYFRAGSVVVGSGVGLGALLRAVLPERRAGLLVVRHRVLDVTLMTAVAVGVIVLAIVVPGRA